MLPQTNFISPGATLSIFIVTIIVGHHLLGLVGHHMLGFVGHYLFGLVDHHLLGLVGHHLLGLVGHHLLGLVGHHLLGLVGHYLLGLVGHHLLGFVGHPLLGLVSHYLLGLVGHHLLGLVVQISGLNFLGYHYIRMFRLIFKSSSAQQYMEHRAVHLLSRYYDLTITSYKYLEIGINAGPPSYVEIALGDHCGHELSLSLEEPL
ncbi:hypothetical protein ALC53_03272 [Atta colombica]|uniref:Uncharacterized protein n=1 Tax=Atta colombica TaxID=520822 RepID=A0A195BNN8_9HYME|nr:hypothetical protein ALC53_03272 [Atta colombica]